MPTGKKHDSATCSVCTTGIKRCTGCGQTKPVASFQKNRARACGYQCHCKECFKTRFRKYSPERRRRSHVERFYNLPWDDYLAQFGGQNGRCAICATELELTAVGRLETAHVDHDHETGLVRGLLCHHCNSGLGYFHDDPDLLKKATAYLLLHIKMKVAI